MFWTTSINSVTCQKTLVTKPIGNFYEPGTMFTRFQPPTTRWFNSWPNFIPKRWRSLNLWVRATFSPSQKGHNRRIARFIQVHGWQSVVNLHGTIKIHQIHSLKLTYPDPVKNAGWKTISLWKSFLFYCHLSFQDSLGLAKLCKENAALNGSLGLPNLKLSWNWVGMVPLE